jgi:CRISPR-associated endonuclease/helicase Cas3
MNWDDPEKKKSHPRKTLNEHIKEVRDIFLEFAKFYELKEYVIQVIEPVIAYHDQGKLNPQWSVDNEHNPEHSSYSLFYLKDKNIYTEIKKKTGNRHYPLVLYFILKHHSALYDRTSIADQEIKLLCTDIVRNCVKNLSFEERINIIDGFGLFKLADSLSASGISLVLEKPNISIELVRSFLYKQSQKFAMIQRGQEEIEVPKIARPETNYLDNKRWAQQKMLVNLGQRSLLTAYTGWGKTDSSLLYFSNKDVKKVFYLFPMITAINKFYEKLNKHFSGVEKYFYFYEYEMASQFGESSDETREFALALFENSHFMEPIIITTVDQFLLTFLQIGKYYMKRPMFREAGIVVDEIHLLNPKMLYLLLHFISKFSSIYKLNVLIMSATFSEAMKKIIDERIGVTTKLDFSDEYKNLARINYSLEKTHTTLIEDVDWIVSKLKEGKRILITVNTVRASILLTRKLEEALGRTHDERGNQVLLTLHGRFMYRDREIKEKQIDSLQEHPHILVSTQVCEVSLNISYDLLLTEIAPVPSLIQRFGRVNRFGSNTKTTNVYIYKPCLAEELGLYPYEHEDMKNAKHVLEEIYPLRNEYELLKKFNELENSQILESKLDDIERELDFSTFWESDERTAYFFSFKLDEEDLKRKIIQMRDELTINVIPDPSIIADNNTAATLYDLLKAMKVKKRFSNEKLRVLHARLKGFIAPLPVAAFKRCSVEKVHGLPTISSEQIIYDGRFGLIERRWIKDGN